MKVYFPAKTNFLFKDYRYKVLYGGRGGAKSYNIAQALVVKSLEAKKRILCARELQSSIKNSVHKLICDIIKEKNLQDYFEITNDSIRAINTESEFIFKGLHAGINEIKSMEGVDICWVEEAENVSMQSWEVLIPTIRKENSEIWISFNPQSEDNPTYELFVKNPPDNCMTVKINYTDNPFLPKTLLSEALRCKAANPEDYARIWLGECSSKNSAKIFSGVYEVADFEIPPSARFFVGIDWGFAQDPLAVTVSFIDSNNLYIAYEAGGAGIELDETASLLNTLPENIIYRFPIKADSSRPETISYIRRQGFKISAAKKWKGCVEDGIAYIKSFDKVIIHSRCTKTASEFYNYSYKTDPVNGDVLPLPQDKNNHHIDALRYSLDGYIQKKELSVKKDLVSAVKSRLVQKKLPGIRY